MSDRHVRPAADVLVEMGGVHWQLSEKLADLVDAVADTGRKGSVTLKLEVAPIGDDVRESGLRMNATITEKMPQLPLKGSTFFVRADGQLTREHPGQQRVPLHEVTSPEVENKEGRKAK